MNIIFLQVFLFHPFQGCLICDVYVHILTKHVITIGRKRASLDIGQRGDGWGAKKIDVGKKNNSAKKYDLCFWPPHYQI